MNEEIKKGNFEFVKEIYPDLYSKIAEAESQAYIDCVAGGRNLRDVFEAWLTHLVNEYGLQLGEGRASLNDKRRILQNEKR